MLVKELAAKFNIGEDVILATLKELHLRAKGDAQELSPGVLVVLKGELQAKGVIPEEKEEDVVKKPAAKKPATKKVFADGQDKKPSSKKKTSSKSASSKDVKADKSTEAPATVTVRIVTKPEPKPVEVPKPAVVRAPDARSVEGPAQEIPNELAQFEKTSTEEHVTTTDAEGKTVVKKIIKTIVKKVVEQPQFVSVKPLAKRREEEQAAIQAARNAHATHQTAAPAAAVEPQSHSPAAPAKYEGPLRDIDIKIPITVGDLAFRIQEKAQAVLKVLMGMGIFANINQNLGDDIARKICEAFGYNLVLVKSQEDQIIDLHDKAKDDPASLKPRAPIVTFMGHVDHGKTSLMDCIRKTKVVDSEHGGITQHIRAYSVPMTKGTITFLDTPGHAAFTAMRSRGAHITDLVVLVVAANEGLMPQTLEAIDHAKAAGVPIIVALNKMDRQDTDVDMVKKQLIQHELMPEAWGGKTVVAPVSAVTGMGIDNLLEMILLESEILELRVNPDKKAAGIVVEAHLSPGRGAVATLIVQSGTLKEGDIVVVGPNYGKVKALFDDHQRHVRQAGPSMPVEILGLSAVPEAGEKFFVVENEKIAREITDVRMEKVKADRLKNSNKITLEDLLAQKKDGEVRELNIVLKADVQGSVEAIREALAKVPSANKEVNIKFIHTGVGDVNASDIILAHVSKAIVISFSVGMNADASAALDKSPVDIRRYNVIYDAVNDMKSALEGMLKPDTKRHFLARAEVRQVFNLSKAGLVAGCFILKGRVRQKMEAEVIRNGQVVHTAKIVALKRFKDDVKEVGEGFECGISVDKFDGYQVGDIIETFQIEQIARKL
ncbi:MAG: translation initiation factor IF-2 [Candidatus Omnitrophota bacterium]